ncbi:MAG: aminotransferase class III-fold pyridoxal phosphate-dependent enzyme [Desulfomonilaceae bacterium]|nr:aminotransferase class III-fold pyridoxal phosphate-dependent enzyme [Desulfomonilaceae bacterium]
MRRPIANEFMADPRIREAKKVLLQTRDEYSARLTGVRPPDSDLKMDYERLMREYGDLRGGRLFYPYLGSGLGNGALVELADGSVKYDFISGIGVHHWGHSHAAIMEASLDAALSDTVMQGNLQQNVESVELARTLLEGGNRKGARLAHCFFSTSGAMANENALKVMFQYKYPANRILAFEGCFMGRTLALSHVTDKPEYRVGLPAGVSVDYVPYYVDERPEESTGRSLDQLKRHLKRYPGKHAGMVFELVLGEGGFLPGNREFFRELMQVLRAHEIPILVDEIQTFGRTTELFAFQYFGLDDFVDVVTVGKASQVCATLFTDELTPGPGLLSQTFTSSTAAIRVGRLIVRQLMDGGFLGPAGRIARFHDRFVTRLQEMEARLPDVVHGPYGIGAMVAFTAFGGHAEKVNRFIHALFDAGVIGFYAGADPTRVRFLIPVGAVTFNDIDAAVTITENTLARMCR